MVKAIARLVFFAGHAPWRSMGSGFRGSRARMDAGDAVTGLVILVAVILGVFILARLLARQERQRLYYSPRALFRSLCKAHQLDRQNRRLLDDLARWQRLTHPAQLFLESHRFDPVNLSPQLREKAELLQKLRDQIFAN
jgi:hypothetical protein